MGKILVNRIWKLIFCVYFRTNFEIMGKGKEPKKEAKKEATKTAKEKRAEKRDKKPKYD